MNTAEFDRLAIRLSQRATRRNTLRTMAALASFLISGLGHSVRAQTGPFDGISLGGPCTDTSECAQVHACNVPGQVLCADNGIVDDGRLTCCLPEGGFCFDAAHCCAELECVSGDGDDCGAGRCQIIPWTSRSTECDAYIASMLAQLPPSTVYPILSTWGQSTPELFALPAHCPWPALPPESPWCTPEYCTDQILLEHSDDGGEYCYWDDPDLAGDPDNLAERPRHRARWQCGSLELIASTP